MIEPNRAKHVFTSNFSQTPFLRNDDFRPVLCKTTFPKKCIPAKSVVETKKLQQGTLEKGLTAVRCMHPTFIFGHLLLELIQLSYYLSTFC